MSLHTDACFGSSDGDVGKRAVCNAVGAVDAVDGGRHAARTEQYADFEFGRKAGCGGEYG